MTRFWVIFSGVALGAVVLLAVVFRLQEGNDDRELWNELGKGAIQVIVVGTLGTVLKLLLDDVQASRLREQQLTEFRTAWYRRTVSATEDMENVPILLEANRSVKTWSEQMQVMLRCKNELRLITHEIWSAQQTPEPPCDLRSGERIIKNLERMADYVDWVVKDFRDHKSDLGELQREAAAEGTAPKRRQELLEKIWTKIGGFDPIADLLGERQATSPPSWAACQANYAEAVNLMVRNSLRRDHGRRSRDRGDPAPRQPVSTSDATPNGEAPIPTTTN